MLFNDLLGIADSDVELPNSPAAGAACEPQRHWPRPNVMLIPQSKSERPTLRPDLGLLVCMAGTDVGDGFAEVVG